MLRRTDSWRQIPHRRHSEAPVRRNVVYVSDILHMPVYIGFGLTIRLEKWRDVSACSVVVAVDIFQQ